MFKIAKADFAVPFAVGNMDWKNADPDVPSQFCISENWSGDMSSGIIRLEDRSAALHGLATNECGLLSLMRCYEPMDRAHILELFEEASTASARFCFSTTIALADGNRQPVFCIAESSDMDEPYCGIIKGIFMFPRFTVEPGAFLRAR